MMMRVLVSVLLGFAIFMPVCAQADAILAPGHTWEYTFADPTAVSTWATSTGGWTTGPAPFGNYTTGSYDPAGYFSWKTWWEVDAVVENGDDLWVRTKIDLTGYNLATISWDLGVDNGFKLYANGVLVSQANGEGYTYRWEYSGDFSAVSLNSGLNVFAVALEDHGGLTAFDMQITGSPVPVPPAILLLGSGLLGLLTVRRRLRK